jgi:RNA polymerase sigma-70 factor (family 1)
MKPELENDLMISDSQAFIELYREHWKSLYNSAYRILKNKQASEDILQDIFINIWKKRGELQINSSIKAYLLMSVRYEVYRKVREDQRFEPILNEMAELFSDCSVEQTFEYKECLQQITFKVKELPEKCREVYMLSRNEHLSHKEISARLSISTKTVRNHLTRALRELRLELTDLTVIILILLFR